jgi:hypothetical protein
LNVGVIRYAERITAGPFSEGQSSEGRCSYDKQMESCRDVAHCVARKDVHWDTPSGGYRIAFLLRYIAAAGVPMPAAVFYWSQSPTMILDPLFS